MRIPLPSSPRRSRLARSGLLMLGSLVVALACGGQKPDLDAGRFVAVTDEDGQSQAHLAFTGQTTKKAWRGSPQVDRFGDSLLVEFPEPVSFDAVALMPCGGTGTADYTVYADGSRVGTGRLALERADARDVPLSAPVRQVRVAFEGPTVSPTLCVFQVEFKRGIYGMEVGPPPVVPATVTASSTLSPATAYAPSFVVDGRPDYAWLEGSEGLGTGEWVQIELASPQEVHAVHVLGGYQRSSAHYQGNARASRLQLSVDGKDVQVLDLPDEMGFHEAPFPEPITGTTFRFRVLAAHPSTSDPDLAISEIRLLDADGPLQLQTDHPMPALSPTHPVRLAGGEWLVDLCSQHARSLKLRQSSFMYTERAGNGVEAPFTRVFDGAWGIGRRVDGPWQQITLHGRDRVGAGLPMYFDPTDSSVKATMRGGRLNLAEASRVSEADWPAVREALLAGPAGACADNLELDLLQAQDALLATGDTAAGVWVRRPLLTAEEQAEGWAEVQASLPSDQVVKLKCGSNSWSQPPPVVHLPAHMLPTACEVTWSDATTTKAEVTGSGKLTCDAEHVCGFSRE